MSTIVHIDFTGTYTEGMKYQENILPSINAKHGHKVYFIASEYAWDNGKIVNVGYEHKKLSDGVELIRLPYVNYGNTFINQKMRNVNGLYELLEKITPDVIMVHCVQALAYLQAVKYKQLHPEVSFYADSHSDFINSAHGLINRIFLQKLFYKTIYKKIERAADKIFFLGQENKDFLIQLYDANPKKLELLAAGSEIPTEEEYYSLRMTGRNKLGVDESKIIFLHTGKFDRLKKTNEIIKAFHASASDNSELILAGVMPEDVKKLFDRISGTDSRIKYIGWLAGKDMEELLCSSDVYLQPGSASSTLEQAACCKCALVVTRYLSYEFFFKECAYFVEDNNDLQDAIIEFSKRGKSLCQMRRKTFEIAKANLDYEKIAMRVEQ